MSVYSPDALFDLMRSRRSIRSYLPDPIPQATIERLLEAAAWSPSAHNRQPWRFAVITSSAVKQRLASAMGQRLRDDRLRDHDPPEAIERDVRRSYARITQAPLLIAVSLSLNDMDRYPDPHRAEAERCMAIQSVSMAAQNLLLMAHALGLGACWMCAPLFCAETVREALALPADWEAQALITLGFPADAGKDRERAALQDKTQYYLDDDDTR
jgi:F420 biosynthesis protein FbiB-like protein